jgi:tetratricopeptide (TPR) repeat protein
VIIWTSATLAALVAAAPGYAGSNECEGCHAEIFEAWRQSRHSSSILDARTARRAGYPLPKGRAWDDLSFTVGGRKRIAFVDRDQRVLGTSYHHRVGGESPFPEGKMGCGPCHHTGFEDDGTFAELNIGCEACHGPGARHVETYEPEDIRIDPSSRMCGVCHTSVDRILPSDDLHATHDLVQVYGRDRHALGVVRNSHSGSCARCHSPFESSLDEESASELLLAEAKHGLTCVGCHDPHATTNPAYQRERVRLAPPLAPRNQTYRGNDSDFTTRDHDEHASPESACVTCHAGADRIELDHADATCVDCHNTFRYNRARTTRPHHDANHRALSCRPCHADDAEHLMTIAFDDPDFFAPRYLHNLRRLPEDIRKKYGFRYAETALQTRRDRGKRTALAPVVAREAEEIAPAPRLVDALERALVRPDEETLARATKLMPRDALLALPLATLEHVPEGLGGEEVEAAEALLARIPRERMNPHVRAYLELAAGRTDDAERTIASQPIDAELARLDALAKLMRGDADAALESLDRAKSGAKPPFEAILTALASLEKRRFAGVKQALEPLLESGDWMPAYLLGVGHLRRRDLPRAIELLEDARTLAPDRLEIDFALARAYDLKGDLAKTTDAYRSIIARSPSLAETHRRLGAVFQALADSASFQNEALEGAPIDQGLARTASTKSLLLADVRRFGELALGELGIALRLDPSHLDTAAAIAEVYRRLGRLEEARECFAYLAARRPDRELYALRLAQC